MSNIFQFKTLGFKSIRRKQGDEYFYNNEVNHRSLGKLFKKFADKPRDKKTATARILQKAKVLLETANKDPVNQGSSLSTDNAAQMSTNKVKARSDSVDESQLKTTAQKREEGSPKALSSDKPSDDLQIFEEVNTCRDLLRDICQKMSKY